MSEPNTQPNLPAIDRTIYPMPMFATFRVADIAATESFYQAVGFVSLAAIPRPDGSPLVVHLRRMRYQDLLLVPGEPEPGSTTVSFASGGQDLRELARVLRTDPRTSATSTARWTPPGSPRISPSTIRTGTA